MHVGERVNAVLRQRAGSPHPRPLRCERQIPQRRGRPVGLQFIQTRLRIRGRPPDREPKEPRFDR